VSDGVIIEAVDVRKNYGRVAALANMNLRIPRGSTCAFLGRNGAGKTTAIKILLGMARADGGSARVFGLDSGDAQASVEIRRRTGFVSEDKALYDYMTVEQIVRFTAGFYPRWRCDLEQRYLREFELPLDRKVKALSLGTKSKLALLLALCRSPELLILDEPTSGLDPAMIEQVLQMLVRHAAEDGVSIFFSSHQIAEAAQIADYVAILHRGRTVAAGELDCLLESHRRVQAVFSGEAPAQFGRPGVRRISREGRVLTLWAESGAEAVAAEARALGALSVEIVPVTLKEIFLETVREDGDALA
jgi:ABC-2 type transport system ATP-binding protein